MKEELSQICESEYETYTTAIGKMGFDPQGFSFMILFDKKNLTREKLLDKFPLSEEEKVSIENRIKLFS